MTTDSNELAVKLMTSEAASAATKEASMRAAPGQRTERRRMVGEEDGGRRKSCKVVRAMDELLNNVTRQLTRRHVYSSVDARIRKLKLGWDVLSPEYLTV